MAPSCPEDGLREWAGRRAWVPTVQGWDWMRVLPCVVLPEGAAQVWEGGGKAGLDRRQPNVRRRVGLAHPQRAPTGLHQWHLKHSKESAWWELMCSMGCHCGRHSLAPRNAGFSVENRNGSSLISRSLSRLQREPEKPCCSIEIPPRSHSDPTW